MTVPNTTYRVLVEKLGDSDPSQFVGNEGEVFYDPNNPALKLSDGTTAGGVSIGGTGGGGAEESYWVQTSAGIHTLSNVGIGTTNPQTSLEVVSGSYRFGFVGIPSDASPFPGTEIGVIYIQNVDNLFDNTAVVNLGNEGGVLLSNYRADFVSDNGFYRFAPVESLVSDIYPSYLNQTFDAFYVGDNVFLASVDNKAYISAPDGIIFGGYGNVGIGTTTPESKLTVVNGDIRVGVDTSNGLILSDSNSVSWRLIVNTDGTLATVLALGVS
jgi:hypothetical protein